MSPKLPSVTAREMIRILERKGYILARQSGSHAIYKHPALKSVTVPLHAKKDLTIGVVHSIMRDAELSSDDLVKK